MTAIRPTIDYVCSLLHRYGVENVTAEVIRQCKFDSADLNVKLEILRIVHGACLLIKSSYHPNCWQRVPSGSDGKYVSRIEVAWEKRSSNDAAALFVLTQILEWSQCAKNSPPSDIQPVSQPFLSPVHAQVLFPGLINLISDRSRLLQQRSEYISKLADAQAKQEEKEAALNTSAQVMLSKEPQRKGGKLLDNGVVVQLSSREMLLVLAWLWMSSSGLRQSDENNGLSGLPNATPDTASETPLAHSLSLFSVHICSLIKRIAHSPLLPPFSPDPSILYLSETCPLGRHTSSSPPNTLPSSSSSSLPSSSFVTIPPYYGSPELDLLRALNTQTANPLIHSLPDPSSLPSPSSFASPSKSLSPTSQPSDDVLSEMLLFVRYRTRQLVTLVAEIRSLFLRLDANHSRIPHMAALLKRDLSSSSESHLNNGSELHSGERQSANNDKRGSRHQPTCTERTVKAQHTKVIEMQKAAEMQLRAIETADRDSVITSSSSSGGGGNGEDVSSSSATVTRARTILEMKSMYSLMTECSSKYARFPFSLYRIQFQPLSIIPILVLLIPSFIPFDSSYSLLFFSADPLFFFFLFSPGSSSIMPLIIQLLSNLPTHCLHSSSLRLLLTIPQLPHRPPLPHLLLPLLQTLFLSLSMSVYGGGGSPLLSHYISVVHHSLHLLLLSPHPICSILLLCSVHPLAQHLFPLLPPPHP